MLMLRCFFLALDDDEFEPVELRRLPDMMAAWDRNMGVTMRRECELLNYLRERNDVNNIMTISHLQILVMLRWMGWIGWN